jgi:hypothetical protein
VTNAIVLRPRAEAIGTMPQGFARYCQDARSGAHPGLWRARLLYLVFDAWGVPRHTRGHHSRDWGAARVSHSRRQGSRVGVAAVLISSLSAYVARRLVEYVPPAQIRVVARVACATMHPRDCRVKETGRDTGGKPPKHATLRAPDSDL